MSVVYRVVTDVGVWVVRGALLSLGSAVLTLMALVALLIAFQWHHQSRFYPGVYVADVALGGLTMPEAAQYLMQRFAYEQEMIITFRYQDRAWQVSAAELGLSLDLSATLDKAQRIGHEGDWYTRLRDQTQAWVDGYSLAPILTYDQAAAAAYLQRIAAEIYQAPSDVSFSLQEAQIRTTDGQMGLRLDIAATLTRLDAFLLTLRGGGEVPLVVIESTPATLNTDSATQRLSTALSAPIHLVASDEFGQPLGPWTLSVAQLQALVRVETADDGSLITQADLSAFADFLHTLAPGLMLPPRDARYHFNEATGQLEVLQPAISGRQLNVNETIRRMEQAVFTPEPRTVPIAFDFTLPRYHNQISAAELGIRELVAESTTYFTGSSANRRHNIALAVGRFDGIVIPPGEEFSFNDILGEISPETGYLEDKIIFGGRTTSGVGGGACQVSTNFFRAAFTGGFAITERHSHGYRVGYYELGGAPPGLDAAIWQPERDFRFQNNTPYHLLIEVGFYPANDTLQIRFYSTAHWRTTLETPIIRNLVPAPANRFEANRSLTSGQIIQVDYAAEGADVTIYRNVYDLNGTLVREDYVFTHYLPWQAIYQVAPDDPRLFQQF